MTSLNIRVQHRWAGSRIKRGDSQVSVVQERRLYPSTVAQALLVKQHEAPFHLGLLGLFLLALEA